MELRIGRLIDHVHLVVRDLAASQAFYRAAIEALGRGRRAARGGRLLRRSTSSTSRRGGLRRRAGHPPPPRLPGRATRRRCGAGTRPSSPPGGATTAPRARATTIRATTRAFALDPDGNNVEAVFHGPATRSADVGRRHRPPWRP